MKYLRLLSFLGVLCLIASSCSIVKTTSNSGGAKIKKPSDPQVDSGNAYTTMAEFPPGGFGSSGDPSTVLSTYWKDANNGMACGKNGKIWITSNATSWTEVWNEGVTLRRIAVSNVNGTETDVVVGDNATILLSTAPTVSWTTPLTQVAAL
jgi:hypothetical protein